MSNKSFENLRLSGILVLLDILLTNRINKLSHVKRRFSEKAERYEEAVTFITRTGMGSQENNSLRLSIDWVLRNKNQRRMIVLQNLLKSRNRYGLDILRFIKKFHVIGGEIVYFPSTRSRSSESAVRNFLMEMNIVKHVTDTSKYMLMSEYANLYGYARDRANYTSPPTLVLSLSAKDDIGFAAEQKILLYERDRVGSLFADKIDHVSQRNVAAGYDIRSFTLGEGATGEVHRFIEVKAVPGQSYRFHWSRNEVNVARYLGDWYYLYLLPINKRGEFDISKLKMIADPYNTMIVGETDWICETDALVCYLKSADFS